MLITIVGAGITGLWQAYTLARAGFAVRLVDAAREPAARAASGYAGAMLAPHCEAEAASPAIRDAGLRAIPLWREAYPHLIERGTYVVAHPRDRADLTRFARMTSGHVKADGAAFAKAEPHLSERFDSALHYPNEAHMAPHPAMAHLAAGIEAAGGTIERGVALDANARAQAARVGWMIDCRGLAARDTLAGLRGVRGERLIVQSKDVDIRATVRLLHPRHPLYVVPWGGGRYMIGATVLESDDASPVSVRSALELLGAAYAIHPGFGEAEVIDFGAGVRPAFEDNEPRIIVRGRTISVNGLYRHGFLLAPVLAQSVAAFLADGSCEHLFMQDMREEV
ncbi:MAG: FAD-dependent oxidoreductase [Pseudomonadota bacterium]